MSKRLQNTIEKCETYAISIKILGHIVLTPDVLAEVPIDALLHTAGSYSGRNIEEQF